MPHSTVSNMLDMPIHAYWPCLILELGRAHISHQHTSTAGLVQPIVKSISFSLLLGRLPFQVSTTTPPFLWTVVADDPSSHPRVLRGLVINDTSFPGYIHTLPTRVLDAPGSVSGAPRGRTRLVVALMHKPSRLQPKSPPWHDAVAITGATQAQPHLAATCQAVRPGSLAQLMDDGAVLQPKIPMTSIPPPGSPFCGPLRLLFLGHYSDSLVYPVLGQSLPG